MTPNKLLIWLPILLAQMKVWNNSYELKYEIRQILYLLYQHNKITKKNLQQFNQVARIMEENIILKENMIVTRDSKTFCFIFDWPKYVHENLKHETEFIIKKQWMFSW